MMQRTLVLNCPLFRENNAFILFPDKGNISINYKVICCSETKEIMESFILIQYLSVSSKKFKTKEFMESIYNINCWF